MKQLTEEEIEQLEWEKNWKPTIDIPCTIEGCDTYQYGHSKLCFKHLLESVTK
jgi:hypothetical protein